MTTRFDFEQHLMACWNVVDDIRTLNEKVQDGVLTTDRTANYLLGLETIYAIKFENMFHAFEKMVHEGKVQ